jgi:hypothetical protein
VTIVEPRTHGAVVRIVAAVRQVPDRYREYGASADDARRLHRIPDGLLARLVRHGLPRLGEGADALFDDRDLANVSAGLALRSAWYFGQRGWTAALERLAAGEPASFAVSIQPRCPYPGHPGQCRFRLWLGRHDDGSQEPSEGATAVLTGPASFVVHTGSGTGAAPSAVADLLSVLAGVSYLNLPVELERDLGFFDRARVANCSLAAAAAAREARRRGVPVRCSFGLVIVPPYAGLHNWVEFLVGDHWACFDPHLIGYLEAAGIITPGWWPPLNSVGGLLLRLAETGSTTSLATHDGLHAEISLRMQRLS